MSYSERADLAPNELFDVYGIGVRNLSCFVKGGRAGAGSGLPLHSLCDANLAVTAPAVLLDNVQVGVHVNGEVSGHRFVMIWLLARRLLWIERLKEDGVAAGV